MTSKLVSDVIFPLCSTGIVLQIWELVGSGSLTTNITLATLAPLVLYRCWVAVAVWRTATNSAWHNSWVKGCCREVLGASIVDEAMQKTRKYRYLMFFEIIWSYLVWLVQGKIEQCQGSWQKLWIMASSSYSTRPSKLASDSACMRCPRIEGAFSTAHSFDQTW